MIQQHCNAEFSSASIFKEKLTLPEGKCSNNKTLHFYTSASLKALLQQRPVLLSPLCMQEAGQRVLALLSLAGHTYMPWRTKSRFHILLEHRIGIITNQLWTEHKTGHKKYMMFETKKLMSLTGELWKKKMQQFKI